MNMFSFKQTLGRIAFFVIAFAVLSVGVQHVYAASNIVPNGDFETVSTTASNMPQGWTTDSWGTITPSFTYPVAGYNSAKAARVDVTKYTSGDAKWYFGDVPVTAGTTYQISDNYMSNVATEVDAEFLLTNGTYSYVQIASPASSNGAWTSFSGSVTVPAGVKSMSIIHVLFKVGYLVIDNVSVSSGTTPPPPAPTCTLSANPTSVQAGGSSTLTFASTNATAGSINQGVGSVGISGTKLVSPATTTLYTGTFSGAGGTTTCTAQVTVTPAPSLPTISSFVATPSTINTGGSSVLSWAQSGATTLSINQGVGVVSGTSKSVSPTATTTYTLTASNSAGTTTAQVTVNVVPPPPAPTCTLAANPTSIVVGSSTTLTFASTNATTGSINQGVGSVGTAGTKVVSPATTTLYTGTFSGAGGTTTCTAQVTVTVPPPTKPVISSFVATPTTIQSGQSSTLSWVQTGATTLSIDQGVGVVTGTSKVVSPTATTTYTLTATNSAGATTAQVTINVTIPQPVGTSSNLVPNGNLEAGTANNPTGWNADYWGSLKATFTYPVTGADGPTSKAAQVTVASYKSGDADWDFDPITVTPGQAYTFSDSYTATVDTEVDVLYKVAKANNIPGECSTDTDPNYVDCSEVMAKALAPSATFKTFSTVISPPTGTVSMTILHMLVTNGTLTVDDYSVTAGVDPSVAYAQGIVSLSFDDGYLDHFTNAFPILQGASSGPMHGTFYMIPNDMTDPTQTGYMTIAQMLQMQAAGNDMASHAADHCDLVALYNNPNSAKDGGKSSGNAGDAGIGCPDHALAAATTSQAEITNSKVQLAGMGITQDNNLAYPFGSYQSVIEPQIKNGGFLAARTIDVGYNTKITNPYALVVQDLDMNTSVATVQSWINTAVANKVWLILVFHQIEADPANFNDSYAETPTTLQGVVNYLAQTHTCVLTVGQVVSGVTSCQ